MKEKGEEIQLDIKKYKEFREKVEDLCQEYIEILPRDAILTGFLSIAVDVSLVQDRSDSAAIALMARLTGCMQTWINEFDQLFDELNEQSIKKSK